MNAQSSRPRQAHARNAAVAVLAGSIASIGVAYAAAIVTGATSTWSAWVMAIATSFAMVATMALGAARTGQLFGGLRRLLVPFGLVLLIMLVAFAAALLLPAGGEPLLLGLPRRAAMVLYGVGVLPVLILPVAYALTFDELTLTEEDIERVREAASRAEPEARE